MYVCMYERIQTVLSVDKSLVHLLGQHMLTVC
jgi:hypothetical protein